VIVIVIVDETAVDHWTCICAAVQSYQALAQRRIEDCTAITEQQLTQLAALDAAALNLNTHVAYVLLALLVHVSTCCLIAVR